MNITWSTYAKLSYYEELDFINNKWTIREVENFIILVEKFTIQLSSNTARGKYYPNNDIYSKVISKQTTVFYRIDPKRKAIELLLFWNNKRNPDFLIKILAQL
jgi:hypothetical protein